jgi:hypothetical protein
MDRIHMSAVLHNSASGIHLERIGGLGGSFVLEKTLVNARKGH